MDRAAAAAKARAARKSTGGTRKDAEGFTDKERQFVLHYLGAANRSGTEAAILAGFSNGSRSAAKRYAYQLLRRPHIVEEVERLQAERREKLKVTAEDVLRRLLEFEVDVRALGKSAPAMRTRLDTIKAIGEHVAVGAFRRQVGLSSPSGGPIETVDLAMLATLSDEELDQLERAREIVDRLAGRDAAIPDSGGDPGGEGAPTPEA